MAIKYIRIGSCDNIFGYNDAVHDSAIETTDPIKAGTPIDLTDVLRLEDLGLYSIATEDMAYFFGLVL